MSRFPHFDALQSKMRDDPTEVTLADDLQAAVEIAKPYEDLYDRLYGRIGQIAERWLRNEHGRFNGFKIDTKEGQPVVIVKLERNMACGCHPEYQDEDYPILVADILAGTDGMARYTAAREAEKQALKEKHAQAVKDAEAEKQRKEEQFEALKQELGK